MALSQIHCLDDNHVNPRTHEAKAEFLYCENQRLALEALLRDGHDAFAKCLQERGLRGFLSDPELETLAGAAQRYDPDAELLQPGDAEDGEPPLSLQYWPELSDTSVPQMDLGWPDCDSYRGVTRASVYTQPPLDGQTHIKEVVRKMIAQAQKVIAVVMDVFTDVDIFRDLLDAGFKRRVSVYILLERTRLPHFLSMCQRANMHAGQLKNLRVRCTQGTEFCTRSCTRVRGQLGHRFMFIDGDKAVSGSYSFTWMSSRLDRNLITVVTGQAVDAFDRLFRFLYATSSSVDLRQVATEPAPEPEILPKPAVVAPPSAADARKLYNPKYALVALANPGLIPSAAKNSSKEPQNSENSKEPEVQDGKKRKRRRGSKDAIQDAFPLHPGLANLEKACLIAYLPTWPEPDPSSDVIGFINIRDAKKPTQVHLQRSEMFETSQAIRFSSPFNMPKEVLPEVAQLKQSPDKHKETSNLQPGQNKTESEKSVVDSDQPPQLNAEPSDIKIKGEAPERISSTSEQKVEPSKDITKSSDTAGELHLKTPANQDEDHKATSNRNAHKPPQSNSNTSSPKAVNTNSPKPQFLPGPYPEKEAETIVNKQSTVNRTHTMDLSGPVDPNSAHTETMMDVLQTDLQIEALNTQPHKVEMTPNNQTPTVNSSISAPQSRYEELSEDNHMVLTSVCTVPATSCSSSVPPLSASSTTLDPPLPPSPAASPLTSSAPIPKPRTVQLVIKDNGTHDEQNLPEISVVKRNENLASTEQPTVNSKSDAANVTPPENEPETVPQLESSSGNVTGAQTDTESAENPKEAPEHKQNGPVHMKNDDKTNELHDDISSEQSAAGTEPQVQTDVLPDAQKALSGNIQHVIPKELEPLSLTPSDYNLLPKTGKDNVATAQTDTKPPEKHTRGSELTEEPHEMSENVIPSKTYVARAHEPQRTSDCEVTPAVLDEESLKSSVSATTNSHISKDSQQNNPTVTPAHHTDSKPPIAKCRKNPKSKQTPKAQGSSHTPERPLRLHLSETHLPNLHSPNDERESRPPTPLVRTPTPDGVLPSTPTSDSRTQSPDPQQHTPHFRTVTPDVSDGYISTRDDSPFSTTSDEFFECSDSPLHDPVFDRAGFHSHRTTMDHDSFTHMNPRNAKTITSTADSPMHINITTLDTKDRNTFSCETQSLSTGVSSGTSEENESQEDENGLKPNVAKRRTGLSDSQETESRGSDKSKTKTVDNLKPAKESTEAIRKDKEAKPQVPKRKRALNQSVPQSLILGGVNPAESSSQATDTNNPGKVSSNRSRPVKEKMVNEAALRASGVDRTDVSQLPREAEGQRLQHSPSRPPAGQQQDSEVSSPASAIRSGVRLRQNQQCSSKAPVSAHHAHTNIQSQSQDNQAVSEREARRQEDRGAPFTFTFRRLYNLKELKDQMKQRRRGSTGSYAQGRKSTS